jgi:hypothetical protein
MGTMLDTSDDPASTFHGLHVQAVAAYANGSTANFERAKAGFPHVHLLKIDVLNAGVGNCGDFEAGDIRFAHAGGWAKGRLQARIWRPVLYFSVSNWGAAMSSLHASGIQRGDVRIWTAHYNGRRHICSAQCTPGLPGTADATQWGSAQSHGTLPPELHGRNVDVSETSDAFWGRAPVPEPFTVVLQEGSQGPQVRRWQQRMADRGWPIAVTGTYDAASEAICKAFQAEKGLTVTGHVNEPTWDAAWTAPITA